MSSVRDFEIFTADASHLDALTGLFDAYRQFYGKESDPVATREFLAERLVFGQSVSFIALDGQEALGFTQLYPLFSSVRMAPMWLLNDLYVAVQARGRGVGTALLERARAYANETGACCLMLETGVDSPARRLYERCNWRHITERVFYERDA